MNKHPPPPPINVLLTSLYIPIFLECLSPCQCSYPTVVYFYRLRLGSSTYFYAFNNFHPLGAQGIIFPVKDQQLNVEFMVLAVENQSPASVALSRGIFFSFKVSLSTI